MLNKERVIILRGEICLRNDEKSLVSRVSLTLYDYIYISYVSYING